MVFSFEDFPKNLLLSGLFIICIIGFMTGLGLNYGEDLTTPYINTSKIEYQLDRASDSVEDLEKTFKEDSLFLITGTIVLKSIWGISISMFNTTGSLIELYLDIFTALFGIPPIVTGVITTILLILLIFLAWRTVKQG